MKSKLLMLIALGASAMTLSAAEPQRLALEPGAHYPVLSPDGSTLLYSTVDHNGLKAFNLSTGDVTVIDTEVAAGFNPVFSTDGSTVFYRTASYNDGLLCRDVRSFSFADARSSRISAPSRDHADLHALASTSYAFDDYDAITVNRAGKIERIAPLADAHSYLWASLSPDASRLVFVEPFSGVYLAKADGSEAVKVLEKGDYVAWAGQNTLIAVVSKDDGYQVTESHLISYNVATGITTTLTAPDMIVGEAAASASGKVAFTDVNGCMYILDINAQ